LSVVNTKDKTRVSNGEEKAYAWTLPLTTWASKGTAGNAKCVMEILGRGEGKNKEVRGTQFTFFALQLYEHL